MKMQMFFSKLLIFRIKKNLLYQYKIHSKKRKKEKKRREKEKRKEKKADLEHFGGGGKPILSILQVRKE